MRFLLQYINKVVDVFVVRIEQVPQVQFLVMFDVSRCVERQRLGRDSAENCFFGVVPQLQFF